MYNEVWESLQAELKTSVAELSPSQLWLRLVLLRKHRASPPVWLTSTLAPKNHEALVQTLMVRLWLGMRELEACGVAVWERECVWVREREKFYYIQRKRMYSY